MKTKCPACGATTSLDALLGHSEASRAFLASLKLTGDLAAPLIKYLGLFRSENRDLTFERTAKILDELAPAITAKQVQRNRQTFPAPTSAWVWAINTMLERRTQGKLQLPLKNHNYLYEVISSYKPEQHCCASATAPTNFPPDKGGLRGVSLVTEKSLLERAEERATHERQKHEKPVMGFAEMLAKAQVQKTNTDEKPHRELKGIPTSQLLAHLKQKQLEGETADQCYQRLKALETQTEQGATP